MLSAGFSERQPLYRRVLISNKWLFKAVLYEDIGDGVTMG